MREAYKINDVKQCAGTSCANVRSAHLNDVARASGGFAGCNEEGRVMMETYWEQINEDQRVTSLRLVWQDLWCKASGYLTKEEMKQIGDAFVFAAHAHAKQRRHTGEPYVIHTVSVAGILSGMWIDCATIIAALLHDVLEDTEYTYEQLKEKFGEEIVTLVDGVTKLGKLQFESVEEYQSENLRKMFVVMARDIRVVLIKLADRLHNMRTISSHRREKQISIAKETLEIYAPLAHRLGIYQLKRELEDLSFKITDPEMFYDLKRRVRKKLPERENIIKEAIDIIAHRLAEENIKSSVKGRPKHFYSIFEKMRRKNLSLEQLYDLLALRVIVDTVGECYQVLGIVHTIWKPIPGLFDDYIANPKSNMYQSLHTTVVGPHGEPLEVQIRTKEMNIFAEYGIAAHWNYKEGGHKIDNLDKGLTWIRKALESSPDSDDGTPVDKTQFLKNLKTDVLSKEVFVFTPKGKVVRIPIGSTPIDFAYAVHTQVGHMCVGAMINGRIAPMDQELSNGDIVNILTSPQGKPSRDWLKIAKSSKTRSKIKSYFKQQERAELEEKMRRGRELLEKEAAKRSPKSEKPYEQYVSQLTHAARELGYGTLDELTAAVGAGNHSPSGIFGRFSAQKADKTTAPHAPQEIIEQASEHEPESEIVVEGVQGVLVSLAQCCSPIPGDEIRGVVTQTRGISVHRKECRNLKNQDKTVAVSWGKIKDSKSYTAKIKIEGVEKPSLLADVTQAISLLDGVIVSIRGGVYNNTRTKVTAQIMVRDIGHLNNILAKLNNISGVFEVLRV